MSDLKMYQVSTLQALMLGYSRSVITVGELIKHGNTGLGTFEDVDSPSEYYFHPVYWANLHGITNGTDATHFSPHAPCTRGQIVTFIYRAFSEPVTFIFYEG